MSAQHNPNSIWNLEKKTCETIFVHYNYVLLLLVNKELIGL